LACWVGMDFQFFEILLLCCRMLPNWLENNAKTPVALFYDISAVFNLWFTLDFIYPKHVAFIFAFLWFLNTVYVEKTVLSSTCQFNDACKFLVRWTNHQNQLEVYLMLINVSIHTLSIGCSAHYSWNLNSMKHFQLVILSKDLILMKSTGWLSHNSKCYLR